METARRHTTNMALMDTYITYDKAEFRGADSHGNNWDMYQEHTIRGFT